MLLIVIQSSVLVGVNSPLVVVPGSTNFSSSFIITSDADKKSWTFTFTDTNLTFPSLITFLTEDLTKAYSSYLLTEVSTGTWSTINAQQDATMWGRCLVIDC